jgi:lipid II:glycine glycyltransferase (peptidoglycan interpeptide bridge formation enzyme)
MDLSPSLEELHRGLHHKWRYHLSKARKQNLELVEGEEDELFEAFETIYDEMVDRKKFVSFTDIREFRKIQRGLVPGERMRVFLCKANGEVCSGGIGSALGDTGIYLFGATSNRGMKTYGSYLVHWRMLEWVKSLGCGTYDLNGIDPAKNPGGYQFKSQLAGAHGREVTFLGQYDAYPNAATKLLLAGAEVLRAKLRRGREVLARWR